MKWYQKLWVYPLMLLNACASAVLVVCAYSQLFPAARMPLVSLAGLAFPFALATVVAFLLFWMIFRRRSAWLSVLTLLVCSVQIYTMFPLNISDAHAPKKAMKLLSYNVYGGNIQPQKMNDENAVLNYVGDSKADIICLQECHYGTLSAAADKNKLEWISKYPYHSYDIHKDNSEVGKGLVCLSKYPILSGETITFKETGNGFARYRILLVDDTLTLYNCHLQSFGLNDDDKSNYEEILADPKENLLRSDTKELVKKLRDANAKRAVQADSLTERIRQDLANEATDAVIVCGDFNDSPVSYAHYRVSRLLDDAYTHSGNGFGFSYHRNKMYFRIDHIMASRQFRAYGCRVDKSIDASDHYPITCSFKTVNKRAD